jgi:hypothetical protein
MTRQHIKFLLFKSVTTYYFSKFDSNITMSSRKKGAKDALGISKKKLKGTKVRSTHEFI